MKIRIASSDAEIASCYRVMVQLRTDQTRRGFVQQVKRQARGGYRLAYGKEGRAVRVVAGFRMMESLSRGLHLHVDDLVTYSGDRSKGYGATMFRWLTNYAKRKGCKRLDLESGVQRFGAHRFYFRRGMHISAYHFIVDL